QGCRVYVAQHPSQSHELSFWPQSTPKNNKPRPRVLTRSSDSPTGKQYFDVFPQKFVRRRGQYRSCGFGALDWSLNFTGTNRPSKPAVEPSEACRFLGRRFVETVALA